MWHEQFSHPLFSTISAVLEAFSARPDLATMNRMAAQWQATAKQFVAQDYAPRNFADHYEPRIFLNNEVQTRENNWHDFFNYCVWNTFPQVKAAMNAAQYHALAARDIHHSPRSQRENALTLFDENGAIVTSSDPSLLALLQNHSWTELFLNQREAVLKHMRVFIVGHALYEKALAPYKSMTASCLLFNVAAQFNALDKTAQLHELDVRTTQALAELQRPKHLQPLPLFGYPGWADAQTADYYADSSVFRPQRRAMSV